MKSWKDNFGEVLDINQMLQKYEVTINNYKKYIHDLELKNKTLHKCAYTAHAGVADIMGALEKLPSECVELADFGKCVAKVFGDLGRLKLNMEEILENGNKSSDKPTLYVPGNT